MMMKKEEATEEAKSYGTNFRARNSRKKEHLLDDDRTPFLSSAKWQLIWLLAQCEVAAHHHADLLNDKIKKKNLEIFAAQYYIFYFHDLSSLLLHY